MLILKTVDDACDFIANWCGEKGNRPGPPILADFPVPECIVRLNERVGDLWYTAKPETSLEFEYATPFLGLLGGQDDIIDPHRYARDEDGIVRFVCENQGVWQCAFHPDNTDELLVRGDWCDGVRGSVTYRWHRVPAKTEDALLYTLLINLCIQSNASWDDEAPKPEAARLPLWHHPAWTNFDGFWIDERRTLIYFDGWQVRRR
jgi:hypothetical protein